MAVGVVLGQVIAAGAHLLNHLPGQGVGIDGDSAHEAFGHADDFVAQGHLMHRAGHAMIHIAHVVDEVQTAQSLGQRVESGLQAGLGVEQLRIGGTGQTPGGQAEGLGHLGVGDQPQAFFGRRP